MTWQPTNSRSPEWQRVNRQEDLLALLTSAIDRLKVVRRQAWSEGSWQQVFLEATAALDELDAVHAEEAARWAAWHEEAQQARGES